MELNQKEYIDALVRKNFPDGSISGKQAEFQSDINELKFVYVCDSTCSIIYVDKPIDIEKTYCSDCIRHFILMGEIKQ